MSAAIAHEDAVTNALPSRPKATLMALLRELSAAQEQYRLGHHAYAKSVDSLRAWLSPRDSAVMTTLAANGDSGWSARATFADADCSMWVRDSTLRDDASHPEGVPACAKGTTAKLRTVRTVLAPPPTRLASVRQDDIRGSWAQHRADVARSGIASASTTLPGPYRWTARLGGELRASAAVTGNQVFVGAHGNGEFAALTLDSGLVQFRVRAPNWIHHEPVVTPEFAIVGFGNNELRPTPHQPVGSDPSGIVAYERGTGVERWRHYTAASMMTSPVLRDSIVAGISTSREAIGWRVSDGRELWRTALPSESPMGNPLLIDTLMVIGLERSSLCVLDVRTGARIFCRGSSAGSWGGGHASVASTGRILLHVFDQGVSLASMVREHRWRFAAARILRLPGLALTLSEQVLVGLELSTGRELWRVRLGIGEFTHTGHVAGTPSVVGGIAYVPSPISGNVFAIDPTAGRVLWSRNVHTVRGSVLVTRGAVLAATSDTTLIVLDAMTGQERCRQRLPGLSDRAGPTLAGETGIMTFRNGIVAARPVTDWLTCHV